MTLLIENLGAFREPEAYDKFLKKLRGMPQDLPEVKAAIALTLKEQAFAAELWAEMEAKRKAKGQTAA